MPRKNKKVQVEKIQNVIKSHFKLEFLNSAQKLAYEQFDKQDVLFLLGAAGTGKSHYIKNISEVEGEKESYLSIYIEAIK